MQYRHPKRYISTTNPTQNDALNRKETRPELILSPPQLISLAHTNTEQTPQPNTLSTTSKPSI